MVAMSEAQLTGDIDVETLKQQKSKNTVNYSHIDVALGILKLGWYYFCAIKIKPGAFRDINKYAYLWKNARHPNQSIPVYVKDWYQNGNVFVVQ